MRIARKRRRGLKMFKRSRNVKPSNTSKVVSLVKSVSKHVAGGMKNVSDEEYVQRLAVCNGCDYRVGDECEVCGCVISRKARWKSEDCLKEFWEKL